MKQERIQVNFRMTKSLKEKLKRQAKELGTSMRKIIEHKIKDHLYQITKPIKSNLKRYIRFVRKSITSGKISIRSPLLSGS